MSVLNVNMPERDLDPEEIDLEQEEEDAFGECPRKTSEDQIPGSREEWC